MYSTEQVNVIMRNTPHCILLGEDIVLVENNKRDTYYEVRPTSCTCPAFQYGKGKPCKHMRACFPEKPEPKKVVKNAPSDDENLKPTAKWAGGQNGPWLDD